MDKDWDFIKDILPLPETWSVDILKNIYGDYVVKYDVLGQIYYSTNKIMGRHPILSSNSPTNIIYTYEEKYLRAFFVTIVLPHMEKQWSYITMSYIGEAELLNEGKILDLIPIEEFIDNPNNHI